MDNKVQRLGVEDAQVVQANHVSFHFSTMEHFMTVRKEIAHKERIMSQVCKTQWLKIAKKVSFFRLRAKRATMKSQMRSV